MENRRPKYFPDSNFPDPLLCNKHCHAENTHATDKDRERRENAREFSNLLLIGKLLLIFLLHEPEIKGFLR